MMKLNIEEIKQLIPHRHPFILIDKITDVVIGESCISFKNVSYDSWYFQGHFPNLPIMPGVLIIEAMAQTAAVLAVATLKAENKYEKKHDSLFFTSIDKAKFKKPVIPGDILKIEIKILQRSAKLWKFNGQAFVENTLSDSAEFMALVP